MNESMKRYRMIDIGIFTALAIVSEMMGFFLHNRLSGAGYYISFGILLSVAAMIRWGRYGSLVYIIASVPMVFLANLSVPASILVYPVAHSILFLAGMMMERVNIKGIIDDNLNLFLMVLGIFALIAVGRGFAFMLLGEPLLKVTAFAFLANTFTMVMSYILLLLLRNKEGLLTDMYTYMKAV